MKICLCVKSLKIFARNTPIEIGEKFFYSIDTKKDKFGIVVSRYFLHNSQNLNSKNTDFFGIDEGVFLNHFLDLDTFRENAINGLFD